jgi:hypothetical protein
MLENGRFQSELGIRADCPWVSRYRIHMGKAMNSTRLMARREAVVADWIVVKSALTILCHISLEFGTAMSTYAKTYDNNANPLPAIMPPTQSTSVHSFFARSCFDRLSASPFIFGK